MDQHYELRNKSLGMGAESGAGCNLSLRMSDWDVNEAASRTGLQTRQGQHDAGQQEPLGFNLRRQLLPKYMHKLSNRDHQM